MRRLRSIAGSLVTLFGLFLLTGIASAQDKGVQFDVTLSGRVDCESPRKLNNLPLSFKGKLTMRTDGSANAKVTMTAAHFISFKYDLDGKLGAKPVVQSDGTYIGFNVAGRNGLRLLLGYPTSEYIIDAVVDGKKCGLALTPKLKKGETQYSIIADGTLHLCSRFEVRPTSCSVKEIGER